MIEIYTLTLCPACRAAKRFLDENNQAYTEINIKETDMTRDRLEELTGGRTVPQIVIDGNCIGGFDEMMTLDAAGKLNF